MKAWRILLLLGLGAFFVAPAWGGEEPEHLTFSVSPAPVPPLVFEDADGGQHALADYRGRFVFLTIWATWCAACQKEMPSLDALQAKVDSQKIVVLPLAQDREAARVSAFYKAQKLTHLPVALDKAGHAPRALRLQGVPTTVILDPQGREIARMTGDRDWAAADIAAWAQTLTSSKNYR